MSLHFFSSSSAAASGSMIRHAVNQTSAAMFGINLPYGTLSVNIVGSLMMGLIAGWFAFRGDGGQLLRLFLTTGILGGFTTFSALLSRCSFAIRTRPDGNRYFVCRRFGRSGDHLCFCRPCSDAVFALLSANGTISQRTLYETRSADTQ